MSSHSYDGVGGLFLSFICRCEHIKGRGQGTIVLREIFRFEFSDSNFQIRIFIKIGHCRTRGGGLNRLYPNHPLVIKIKNRVEKFWKKL